MNRATGSHLSKAFIALLLTLPALAQAQEAIGRIIKTSGVVSAVDAAGASRPLARGSEFFTGETISTGGDGSVEFRLSDGAVLSMTEDAQFIVNAYQNDGPGGAADTAVMTMLKGAMRTISGTIGETPGDTYQMNTPYASIGIRGTEYAVRVEVNGRTFVIVFDGGVALTPTGGGGTINLGVGGTSDGAEVQDADTVVDVALEDLPAEAQALVNLIVEQITEQELNSLPPPDAALEVQLQQQQEPQQQDQPQNQQQQQQQAGGALVDAQGNALAVTTETQVQGAREVVVVTVTRVNPTAFSESTKKSASDN